MTDSARKTRTKSASKSAPVPTGRPSAPADTPGTTRTQIEGSPSQNAQAASEQHAGGADHANVDAAEILKFEALAHRWWDPNGEFRPLHDLNPVRLNYIDQRATLPGKRALDVGCGGGLLSEGMAHRGAEVLGIDMGEAPLSVARLHALETDASVRYQRCTIEALAAEQAARYDVVTCMEMLEHVPDPASVVRACATAARPGASLFFSTLNRNAKSFLLAIVGAEYVLNLLPRGTHEWKKFIRPSELTEYIRSAGLEVVDLTGMTYNPITRSCRLHRNVDVNYMIHARKPD